MYEKNDKTSHYGQEKGKEGKFVMVPIIEESASINMQNLDPQEASKPISFIFGFILICLFTLFILLKADKIVGMAPWSVGTGLFGLALVCYMVVFFGEVQKMGSELSRNIIVAVSVLVTACVLCIFLQVLVLMLKGDKIITAPYQNLLIPGYILLCLFTMFYIFLLPALLTQTRELRELAVLIALYIVGIIFFLIYLISTLEGENHMNSFLLFLPLFLPLGVHLLCLLIFDKDIITKSFLILVIIVGIVLLCLKRDRIVSMKYTYLCIPSLIVIGLVFLIFNNSTNK